MESIEELNNNDNPNSFIKSLYGKRVYVKLVDESEYNGTLICLDGLMNLVIEHCEEVKTKDLTISNYDKILSLKETYIRGNNVLYICETS